MSTIANFNLALKAPADLLPEVADFTTKPQEAYAQLARYFERLALGMEPGEPGENTMLFQKGSTAAAPANASGTITMATSSGAVGATIAGTLVTVTWATTDEHSCALLATAINANTTVNKFVKATALLKVVTVTALQPGVLGNLISLVLSGTNVTVSGALLTGGVGADVGGTNQATNTLTISGGSGTVGAFIDGTLITVVWGSSDTATALALAKVINADATIGLKVQADPTAGVIALKARTPGKARNAVTLVASGTGVTAAEPLFSGGTGTSSVITFSR